MMNKLCLSFVLTALIALASAQPRAADEVSIAQHSEVAGALKVLDAWIEATAAQREQPGLSIGIVYDRDLIWAKGYGFADLAKKVPATPATLYRIASISKLFTSTAILQMRDAGKLKLDDPVEKYLSWFKIKNPHSDGSAITIRHLITHTSGLPREAAGLNWNDLIFPTREEMMRRLPNQQRVFPTETEWKYSNLALSIAGEVVAAASGEAWPQYVENHILRPLGMVSTRTVPKPANGGLAVGYGRRVSGHARDIEPFVDIEAERPAGNMAGSVEDLAKFVALQMSDGPAGGRQILKGSTLREMHRVHWLAPDWNIGWGLGFAVRRVADQVRVGHGGSLPGHRTQIEIAPAEKLGVIVLTNANDGNPQLYLDKVFEIVGPAIGAATALPEKPAAPDPSWETYVGTYSWKHSDVQILILKGELTMIIPEADNPWETRVKLEPAGEHTFRAVPNQWSYSLNGETIKFEIDANGRALRVGTANFYWVRK